MGLTIQCPLVRGAAALLTFALAACGPHGASPFVPAASANASAATKEYLGSGGSGKTSWSWHDASGNKCSGTVDYKVNVTLVFESNGAVDPKGSSVTTLGELKPYCSAWGVRSFDQGYDVKGGKLEGKNLSATFTLHSGFCTPGKATGSGTFAGSESDADAHVGTVEEHCTAGTEFFSQKPVDIKGVKGLLIGK
ncbi:MAG: hypothetical protein JO160_02670 [Candidatus Eremiobacteraeota bacterium]|nr:hypothetical protein [Candidatus Eremiobacteraeota bacterium]